MKIVRKNRRSSFRTETALRVQVFSPDGTAAKAHICNISAGGAVIETVAEIDTPRIGVGVFVPEDLRSDLDYLHFEMEVLSSTITTNERGALVRQYRCRHTAEETSGVYEKATHLVFAIERQRLARRSGMFGALAHGTAARRQARREAAAPRAARFTRSAVRGY